MSKVKKMIIAIIALIQILILILLGIRNPLANQLIDILPLIKTISNIIFIFFIVAVIVYILEHKSNNKNEDLLDENLIEPKFNIDIKKYDIIYLSTILNQKLPGRKGIILIIMQLLNKKVIDLLSNYDGNSYQYIIIKRQNYNCKLSDIEEIVLKYLFKKSNNVNLIEKIKNIYKDKEIAEILKKTYKSEKIVRIVKHSEKQIIYKVITFIISVLEIFLGFIIFTIDDFSLTAMQIIVVYLGTALICVIVTFLIRLMLKKINEKYQYNNDTYKWVLSNVIFFNTCLIISTIFTNKIIIHYLVVLIYYLSTLTIMIKDNVHITLAKEDINIRNKLLQLKKYFQEMKYLKDKEFANIITYEECLMYGFLFNITIKTNKEFEILQKELQKESTSYLNLFKEKIL